VSVSYNCTVENFDLQPVPPNHVPRVHEEQYKRRLFTVPKENRRNNRNMTQMYIPNSLKGRAFFENVSICELIRYDGILVLNLFTSIPSSRHGFHGHLQSRQPVSQLHLPW
jgi:hypothetical protein